MANVGSITADILVNTAGLKRGLADASRRVQTFTQKTSSGFSKVRKAVLNTKTAIAGIGVVAVGTALRKTTQEFIKFEDALLDLQKVMSDTEGSAEAFIGVAERLSNVFGESASEVLQGAANFKQAGFTVQEAFELQEVALRSATVSNLDVVESSKIVTKILKGFKAPASEAARALDVMNEVSNKYATSLGELAQGMAEFSPVARLMGFSFEETAAVLTPIIEVFGSGSEAAVAMRTSMLRLVSDQSKVQRTLEALGVAQKDANGQLREGKDILNDVMEAFTMLDKTQKIFVSGQLVGIRQAARFVEVADGINKVLAVQRDGLNSNGSALKEQATRLNSMGKELDRAKQQFINMARAIGAEFSPHIIKASRLATRFINSFRTGGRLRIFTVAVRGAVSILESLARAFFKVSRVILNAVDAVTKFAKRGSAQLDPTDFSPIAGGSGSAGSFLASRGQSPLSSLPSHNVAAMLGGGSRTSRILDDRGGERGQQIRDAVNALGEVEDALDSVENKAQTTMQQMATATSGWASGFAREMTDVLFGAELTFGSILESFARMLTQMAIQVQLINPILRFAFGADIPGGTGSGFFGSLFGGGRDKTVKAADGGIATRPVAGIFGEAGPEAFIPLERMGEFMGGSEVQVNVIGAPEGTRIEETELTGGGRKIDVIIDDIVAGNLRQGTKTSQGLQKMFNNLHPQTIGR